MPQTVLITGLNSFVSVHTTVHFLRNGWNVRGTVRSKDKGEAVLKLPALQEYLHRLAYFVIVNLETGDFADALKGVDAVSQRWRSLQGRR